jgi:HK97 family phage portal protein
MSRLRTSFREATPAPTRFIGFPTDGAMVSAVTGTTALGLSAVWRCLDILSNGVSQLEWHERRGNLDLPPSRLVRRPLEVVTRRDWVSYVVSSLALYDIAYLWKVGGEDAEGVPISLWPVSPPYVSVNQTTYPIIPFVTPDVYYIGTTRVPREDLVILRRSPQPGLADWQAGVLNLARMKFAEVMAADAFASRYWQGGGHVNAYLSTEAKLNDTDAVQLSDRWGNRRMKGPDHIPVMDNGLKLMETGADPTQQAAVEARKELVADIGRYFGVPSHVLNSPQGDNETYSSTESSNQDLVRYTLQNYIGAIEDGISDQLPGGRQMHMDTWKLRTGTFLAQAQAYQLLTGGKAVVAVDEVRDQLGYAPIEDPNELNPPAPAPAAAMPTGGKENG